MLIEAHIEVAAKELAPNAAKKRGTALKFLSLVKDTLAVKGIQVEDPTEPPHLQGPANAETHAMISIRDPANGQVYFVTIQPWGAKKDGDGRNWSSGK